MKEIMKKDVICIFIFVVMILSVLSTVLCINIIGTKESNEESLVYSQDVYNKDLMKSSSDLEMKKVSPPQYLFNKYWAKAYSGPYQDEVVADLAKADNGYMVLGNIWYTSAPSEIFIMKADQTGNATSMIKYDFGDLQIIATSMSEIEVTPGHYEYVIAGYSQMDSDFFVMRIDGNGDVIWAYFYDNLLSDKANAIKTYVTDEEFNFVVAGFTATSSGDQDLMGMIFTLDADGIVRDDAYYSHDDGVVFNDVGCAPSTDNPDEFIVTGHSSWSTGNSGGFLMSVNSGDLSINWAKEYRSMDSSQNSYLDEINSLKITSDGSIVLVGMGASDVAYNCNDMLIIKTNNLGVIDWANTYAISSHLTVGYSVDEIPDSGYIVTGSTRDFYDIYSTELFIALIDDNSGNVLSSRILQGGKPFFSCNSPIRKTWGTSLLWDASVLIIAGSTSSSINEELYPNNIVLIKCSSTGRIRFGCCSEEFAFDLSDDVDATGSTVDVIYPYMETSSVDVSHEVIVVDSEYICNDYVLFCAITWPLKGSLSIFDRIKINVPFIAPNALILGPVTVEVEAYTDEGVEGINRVEFVVNGELMSTDDDAPYSWLWDERNFGKCNLKIIIYDELGDTKMRELEVIKYF